jgi:Ca2+-binding RTX toxin-like protein
MAGQSNANALDGGNGGLSLAESLVRQTGSANIDTRLVFANGAPLTYGRSAADWYNAGEMAQALLATIRAALDADPGAYLGGIIWVQGEADTNDVARVAQYTDRLLALVDYIEGALAPYGDRAADFRLSVLALSANCPTGEMRANWLAIRNQQLALDDPRIDVIDPDAIPGLDPDRMFQGDGLHYRSTANTAILDALTDSFDYTLAGTARRDRLFGQSGDDTIDGGGGADDLYGGAGDDSLFGRHGNDLLTGAAGNDTLDGDAGVDRLYGNQGDDALWGRIGNDQLFGGLGNDTLDGDAGADRLYGDHGGDELWGRDGNDQLFGGAGRDTIVGGGGNDVISGGADGDMFCFLAIGQRAETDRITDFQRGLDLINLRWIDADSARPGDQAFHWTDRAVRNDPGCLWLVENARGTRVNFDVNGDGRADGVIVLDGVRGLTETDFLF